MDPELEEFMKLNQGAYPLRELNTYFGRYSLACASRAGQLKVIKRCVAYLPGTDRRVVVARANRGHVACVTALRKWGVDTLRRPRKIHVAVAHNCHRIHTKNTVIHRILPAAPSLSRLYVDDPVATVVCALKCVDTPEDREVIVDSALFKGLATKEQLLAEVGERGPVEVRQAIELGSYRARSPLETNARRVLRGLGLNVKVGQVIAGIGEVDMVVSNGVHEVIVELDGYEWHAGHSQFVEDRRRSRESLINQLATLRFTWDDVESGQFKTDIIRYFKNHGGLSGAGEEYGS